MDITPEQLQTFLLGPIVQRWYARAACAEKSKERFDAIGKLCRQFLGESAKTMWEDSFRKEFFPAVKAPKFQVSLNKAFELVAVIGPSLFWDVPVPECSSPDYPSQIQIAQALGMGDEDLLKQLEFQQQQRAAISQVRNSLLTAFLEWATKNRPGSIKRDIELIVQEALVTGRGCGWTETYRNPATGEIGTYTTFDSVDNLLIDPDAKDPDWSDVRWIARKHCDPVWKVEEMFGYPPGYLRGRGTRTSQEYMVQNPDRNSGTTTYCDMMDWMEVWSIAGIGARVVEVDANLGHALDQVAGDNCYLCVASTVPHPLNLPPMLVKNGTPDDIKEALRWRTANFGDTFELWIDHRWPVEKMDFYPVSGSVWPQAVLGPGIGALLAMNLLLISQLEQSWDRRRDFIVCFEHMSEYVMQAVRSEDNPAVIKLSGNIGQNLSEVIQYLKRPDIQGDLLSWMEYLDNQFQMATGLDDLHYGISARQVRVSSDIQARQEAANVRPAKMAKDVHAFVVNTFTKQAWLSAQYVPGSQLTSLLGEWGAVAWDMLVGSLSLVELAKEMTVNIEATDMQRPNRDKDMADLKSLFPFWMPILQLYAQETGDTKPLNAILAKFAQASNMRGIEDLYLGDWRPAVDPAVSELQQQQAQANVGKTTAEIEEIRAKTMGRLVDSVYKQQGAAAPMRQKIDWTNIMNQQKMQQAEMNHLQKLVYMGEEMQMKLAADKKKAAVKK